MYVIEPVFIFRRPAAWQWESVPRMETDTEYTSDGNAHWLSGEELRKMFELG